jgi:IPT/TIG domain
MRPLRARSVVVLALIMAAAAAGCGKDDKLKVFGLSPSQGDFNGGQTVTIKGNGFQVGGVRNVKVYFGNRQGTVIRFDGDTDLYVTAPGGKVGETVDVHVKFDPGGDIIIPKSYTFIEMKQADIDDLSTGK